MALRIREQDGELWADSFAGSSIQLKALSENRFLDPELGELDFESNSIPPNGFIVKRVGNTDLHYIPVHEYSPTLAQLRDFAGTYRSLEIDIPYYIALDGNRLMVRALRIDPVELQPVASDLFGGKYLRVRFTRDAHGRAAGLLLSGPWNWVKNLRFDKVMQ
jgi:hypothetical protein